MTSVNELHHFRVQTPSFLISDGAVEVCSQLSNLQQQRILVEQLSREAAMQRISVSQAIVDFKKFISDRETDDYLLVGFPSQKTNPFREKSSCLVL